MSRTGRDVEWALGLPIRCVRLLAALLLLLLLMVLALLLLPPLHWIRSAWIFCIQADYERALRAEQMPGKTCAWIKQRVLGVLRGQPRTEAD